MTTETIESIIATATAEFDDCGNDSPREWIAEVHAGLQDSVSYAKRELRDMTSVVTSPEKVAAKKAELAEYERRLELYRQAMVACPEE